MPFKSEKQRRYMFANEPKIAKKWANEYNMGGVASMFRKKLEDGDLSPEIISQIESMAATGADASTISSLVGVSEEQVNNVLMSGSTSQMMPVEGEEMVETAEVTEEADPLLNLFSQNDSLNNDQALTTLFAKEEPQGIMAASNGGFAMQGGVRNYLGETDTVSEVPIKWKSAPDHPETELAYITKKEKDLLLKKDLHNSLDGSPNKGPEGLISLNGGGYGSENAGTGGNDGFGGGNDNDYTGADYGFVASQPTTPQVAPGEAPVTQEEIDTFNKGPTADGDALDMQDYLTDYVNVNEQKQKEFDEANTPDNFKQKIKIQKEIKYKENINNIINNINKQLDVKLANKAINYVIDKVAMSVPVVGIAYGLAKAFGLVTAPTVSTDISGNIIGKNTVTGPDLGFFQGDEYNDFWGGGPDEDEGGDAPLVDPITGKVNEDFATGNIDYSMMSALDKIRANQARRSGLVESNIVQDNNQIMTANKGGLAGLFRVKNQ
jgi:uncharacterized FlaG/YvyC family protein